jgi:hypothetical protein
VIVQGGCRVQLLVLAVVDVQVVVTLVSQAEQGLVMKGEAYQVATALERVGHAVHVMRRPSRR